MFHGEINSYKDVIFQFEKEIHMNNESVYPNQLK